jgi:hypothetical protein
MSENVLKIIKVNGEEIDEKLNNEFLYTIIRNVFLERMLISLLKIFTFLTLLQ